MKESKEERTARLVKVLQDRAKVFRETDDAFLRFVRQSAKFHTYSPSNQFLIMTQYPEASAVNSFKRWKGLGRQVMKGEQAIWILAPRPYKRKSVLGGEEEDAVYFVHVPVFDYGQTEPIPDAKEVWEPYRFPSLTEDVGGEYVDGLIASLQDESVDVQLFDMETTYRGRFHVPVVPGAIPRIELWNAMPMLQQLNTLVHEIAHYEQYRIDPRSIQTFGARAVEFVAEASSYAVLTELGFDSSAKSVSYVAVQSAVEEDEEKERLVLKMVTSVVGAIMARLEALEIVGANMEAVA